MKQRILLFYSFLILFVSVSNSATNSVTFESKNFRVYIEDDLPGSEIISLFVDLQESVDLLLADQELSFQRTYLSRVANNFSKFRGLVLNELAYSESANLDLSSLEGSAKYLAENSLRTLIEYKSIKIDVYVWKRESLIINIKSGDKLFENESYDEESGEISCNYSIETSREEGREGRINKIDAIHLPYKEEVFSEETRGLLYGIFYKLLVVSKSILGSESVYAYAKNIANLEIRFLSLDNSNSRPPRWISEGFSSIVATNVIRKEFGDEALNRAYNLEEELLSSKKVLDKIFLAQWEYVSEHEGHNISNRIINDAYYAISIVAVKKMMHDVADDNVPIFYEELISGRLENLVRGKYGVDSSGFALMFMKDLREKVAASSSQGLVGGINADNTCTVSIGKSGRAAFDSANLSGDGGDELPLKPVYDAYGAVIGFVKGGVDGSSGQFFGAHKFSESDIENMVKKYNDAKRR